MIYVMSDIHGQTDKYRRLLRQIGLTAEDRLFILGDVVDRGDGGIDALSDMMDRPNVTVLIGNHEWSMATLLGNQNALRAKLGQDRTEALYRLWFDDGGLATYRAYMRLDEATRRKVLDYIQDMHFIYELQVGDKQYFLSHTLPPYSQDVPLVEPPADDFLHGAPDYHTRYLPDCTIVTGHTHTERIDPAYRGRIWQGNGHIAIDCGASRGGRLGCLCLDTMQEFYE